MVDSVTNKFRCNLTFDLERDISHTHTVKILMAVCMVSSVLWTKFNFVTSQILLLFITTTTAG